MKKLEIEDELFTKLKKMQDILAGVNINEDDGLDHTMGCGALCMVTCSYHCESTCSVSCIGSWQNTFCGFKCAFEEHYGD